jgi:16S rRNA (cytosine1402-N4)-methyltransferase
MPSQVVEALNLGPGRAVADCTLGGAGHASRILAHTGPDGLLVGLDQDPDAVANARQVLAPWAGRVHLFQRNFVRLPETLAELGIKGLHGILADLGLSLHHLEGSGRGFSFQRDEPLDMRMDPTQGPTAADLIRTLPEEELRRLLQELGEEPRARLIARRIAAVRRHTPIATSAQLAGLVAQVRHRAGRGRIHPATRVFMALRIAVNRELECLETFLKAAPEWLLPGGRLVVLSFHSLEDRIVKQQFKQLAAPCQCPPRLPQCVCGQTPQVRLITRKPLRPSAAEVSANPLARSTRLRAVERLASP